MIILISSVRILPAELGARRASEDAGKFVERCGRHGQAQGRARVTRRAGEELLTARADCIANDARGKSRPLLQLMMSGANKIVADNQEVSRLQF